MALMFSIFSISVGAVEAGIRNFSYKGTSFDSNIESLKENGFKCDDKNCFKGETGFVFNPGWFASNVNVRNAVSVEFHENNARKIVVEQAYPASGETCESIMKDVKSRFDKKYNANLKFPVIRNKMSEYTDYENLSGKVNLNDDVLAAYFNCVFATNPDNDKRLVYLKASFVYDNLAARLLIDGI